MSSSRSTYDALRGWYAFLFDSYWGGERYAQASSPTLGTARVIRYETTVEETGPNAGKEIVRENVLATLRTYLVPHSGETREQFTRRLSLAAYVNFVAPIVDTYADSVTGNVKRDLGTLGPYLADLDGQGTGWAEHVAEVCRWACVYGMCATVLDPPDENPARNAAEEQAMGIGLRAIVVQPTAWAWVDVDDRGTLLEFAYADQPYADDTAGARAQVCVYVWTRTGWAEYRREVNVSQGLEAQRGAITSGPPDRQGTHALGRVPVVFAAHRRDTSSRAPRGASLVGDVATLCRQVYNVLSSAEQQLRETGFAFLAFPTSAAGAALEPEVTLKVGPSAPLPYRSDTGAPQWVDAPTASIAEARTHALFLLAMCLRLVGLDVSTDQGGTPESGIALRIRSRGFEARAAKLAQGMAHYERQALDLAAAYLGQQNRASVEYPKRFTLPDASEDLDRALVVLEKLSAKLGPAGTEAAVKQALGAALSLSDDAITAIMEEVRAKLAEPAAPRPPAPPPPFAPAGAP